MDVCVVFATFPSNELAATVGKALVQERLAACVNLVPSVRSIYRWQDKVVDEAEVLAIFKTARSTVDALIERLAQLHPYDVPEAIALRATGGLPAYLAWVNEETTRAPKE